MTEREPFRFIDYLIIGYLAFTAMVALGRFDVRPQAGWVLVGNFLILSLIVLVYRTRPGRFATVLRDIYPIMVLPALYGGLDLLNGFEVPVRDATVQAWEAALFGGQVSITWWQAAPSRFWSIVLHAAYFGYYLIIPLPPLYFLFRGERRNARMAVAMIVATFLSCYLFFVLFPVAGPYYEFPRPSGPFVDHWAARLVYATLAQGSSYGAAFPSSHVAATISAVLAAGMGSRRLGLILSIPAVLLTVGVVYCQMHYAVDALAGVLVPLVLYPVIRRAAV